MSRFHRTPLKDPRMEGLRRQNINFEVQPESEPFSKKKRVLVDSKYQANTCDVGIVDGVRAGVDDGEDSDNHYLVSQASQGNRSGMAPVVSQYDYNLAMGGNGQSLDEYNQVFSFVYKFVFLRNYLLL